MKKDLIVIKILAFVGLLIASYLSYKTLAGSTITYCITGSECDVVNSSAYAKIYGLPVSVLGVIGYLFLLVAAFTSLTKRRKWNVLFYGSLIGASFSVYLTYIELFQIKAICSYCVASLIVILAIFILVIRKKESMNPKASGLNLITVGIILSIVVIFGAGKIQSSPRNLPPASDYQVSLAKHLKKSGAVMYGSYKCPHCISQKESFGNAFKYIKYVECSNRGKNANPSLCFTKGIKVYPTWEINGKYYEGQMRLDKLSELTNFEPAEE